MSDRNERKKEGWRYVIGLGLGVLAGIGGFIDTGGIITASQAGAKFHDGLAWTALFGFIGFAVFAEMSGRVTVASSQPTYEAIRERLGPRLAAVPVIANVVNHVLTLAVNFFGMSIALALMTGVDYRVFVPLLAIALGSLLWRVSFSIVDNSAALLGLTMLVTVVAAVMLHPDWGALGLALIHPRIGGSTSATHYLFGVASMLGAFMTPYQFDFYSSGAIEEGWTARDLRVNRVVTVIGTLFGALIALALMVGASKVLSGGSQTDSLREVAQPTIHVLGSAGFYLFFIGVACVSVAASVELCLSGSYGLCQYFGWDWGKTGAPRSAPAFNLIFLAEIVIAAAIDLSGVDPIRFTLTTMAFAAASLPFTFVPILLMANDPQFMGEQRNTRAMNVVALLLIAVLVCVTVATPLLLVLTHGEF